jgi:hypothetical protein
MTDVNDLVQIRIEAARVKIQAAKRRREELSTARRRGLAARHAAKLRNLAASTEAPPDRTPDPQDTDECPPRAGARETDGESLRTAHPNTPEAA